MCGIFGIVSEKIKNPGEFWHFANRLCMWTQKRGTHATGFAALVGEDKDFFTDKRPCSAVEFVKISREWRKLRHYDKIMLVGHTRAATAGSPGDNKNNHPFHSNRYSLTHNGGIRSFQYIARHLDFNLQTECDSELILHLLEQEKDPKNGIINVLSEAGESGWMAVSFLDKKEGKIHLFRDSYSPCYAVFIPRWNVTVYNSEIEIIANAMKNTLGSLEKSYSEGIMIYDGQIPSYHHVSIDENGNVEHENIKDKIRDSEVFSHVITRSRIPSAFSGGHDKAGSRVVYRNDQVEETFQCLECNSWSVFVDEDGFCEYCSDAPTEAQKLLAAVKKMERIENEASGRDSEDDGSDFQSYKSACNWRNPNCKFSIEDSRDFMMFSGISWSQKKRLWSDMTKDRAREMSDGEWRAYVNFLRDLEDESAKKVLG